MKCGSFRLSFYTIGSGRHVLVRVILVLPSEETKVHHPACYITCDNKNNECLSRSIRIKRFFSLY